jgi:hypothetical protein
VIPLLTFKEPVIEAPDPVMIKDPVISKVSALEENTDPPVFPVTDKLPVTPKLPVICADPVKGNPIPDPPPPNR